MKPERWKVLKNKLFTYQVGFTSPPHDFDAAPSDFLRISADNVGAHGRMLHVPDYAHQLTQRVDNFHLLEEFVYCMSNNGADVIRADAQKIARRGIEVMRRRSKTDLIGEQFVF